VFLERWQRLSVSWKFRHSKFIRPHRQEGANARLGDFKPSKSLSKKPFAFLEVVTDSLRCKQHIILLRNTKVEQSLRQTYNKYAVGARLNVSCVSNTLYWKNRQASAQDAQPFLQLSGILALRRHCIGIVADSHLHATVEYIRNEVPAFVGSVELWVQAGSGTASVERKEQILAAVDAIQTQLDTARCSTQ
jgi:hypothetical protein